MSGVVRAPRKSSPRQRGACETPWAPRQSSAPPARTGAPHVPWALRQSAGPRGVVSGGRRAVAAAAGRTNAPRCSRDAPRVHARSALIARHRLPRTREGRANAVTAARALGHHARPRLAAASSEPVDRTTRTLRGSICHIETRAPVSSPTARGYCPVPFAAQLATFVGSAASAVKLAPGVVTVQVGQCGNQLGTALFNALAAEAEAGHDFGAATRQARSTPRACACHGPDACGADVFPATEWRRHCPCSTGRHGAQGAPAARRRCRRIA